MRRVGLARPAVILAGLLLALYINYHSYLSNFNLVPGDKGDTRMLVYIQEHWFKTLKGQEAPFQLNMFYPDKLALGYTDGLVLLALPYACFRLLGFDYFTSYQCALLLMTAAGYVLWLLVLNKALKLNLFFGMSGAVLLTSLNAMRIQADIGQMLGFYYCPLLIYFLWLYATRRADRRWRAGVYLAAFSLALGLLFFTSYYPAWFFLFTLALFGLFYFAISAMRYGARTALQQLVHLVQADKMQLSVSLLVLIVALLPFWITYLPLVRTNLQRGFDLVLDFSPGVRDIINVSSRNYVWSPVLNAMHFDYGNREVQMGSPMIVLVIFGTCAAWLLWSVIRSGRQGKPRDHFMLVLCATALTIFALIVKFHGTSLWYAVYKLVPGASALRAVGRYMMVIDMIAVVAALYGLNRAYRSLSLRAPTRINLMLNSGMALVIAVLITEQFNGTAFRLDKAEQLRFMSGYGAPLFHCRAFYINNVTPQNLPVGYYELDAMMISMNLGMATANGYSGVVPDGVFAMAPSGIEYKYRMLKRLHLNGAEEGMCELDYQSRAFERVDVAQEYPRYEQLNRNQYVETFTTFFSAVQKFLQDGNEPANLYPQYLEDRGYLDASMGHGTGPSYKWIADKYWIGERPCGSAPCVGLGILGNYGELKGIVAKYEQLATKVYFPYPQVMAPNNTMSDEAQGELLLVFPVAIFEK